VFKLRLGQRFAPHADSDACCTQLENYFAFDRSAPPTRPESSHRAPTLS
jgi:hypothetical protein